jgi:hypothetical protein
MNTRIAYVAVGATFALAMTATSASATREAATHVTTYARAAQQPSTNATPAKSPKGLAPARNTTPSHKTVTAVAPAQIYFAPFPDHPIITPRYIYIPASPEPSDPAADPNECEDSMNGCTNLQLCEIWGANCGSLTAADLADASQPAQSDPSTTSPD